MLSCDNICRGVEPFCVGLEEVCVKGFADVEQQLGVEGGFVEDALHRAGGDVDLLGEPLVGVALAAQLIADDVADVYLHSGCCLGDVLPIPCTHSDGHRQKEGEQSRLLTAVVEYLSKERLKCPPIGEHLLFVIPGALDEIFHVSVRSEQIANAMLFMFNYLLSFVSVFFR
jgi:hypothetical protein